MNGRLLQAGLAMIPLAPSSSSGAQQYEAFQFRESGIIIDFETALHLTGRALHSRKRIGGMPGILDEIRKKEMIPGLWLELEVTGVGSPLADRPGDWFFRRHGKKVTDGPVYFLDFRSEGVQDHAEEVADRLASDYRAGYIKMDYNSNAKMGTEVNADPDQASFNMVTAMLCRIQPWSCREWLTLKLRYCIQWDWGSTSLNRGMTW